MTITPDQTSEADCESTVERLNYLHAKYRFNVTEETILGMSREMLNELHGLIPELRAYPFSPGLDFDEGLERARWREKTTGITVDTEAFGVLFCLQQIIPEILHRKLLEQMPDALQKATIMFADDELRAVLAP